MSTLKETCNDLTHETEAKKDARKSELENTQNDIKSKDEHLLQLVKEQNRIRYEEMTKAYDNLLSKVTEEAREIKKELSKMLGFSRESEAPQTGPEDALGLLREATRWLASFSDKVVPLQNTVDDLKTNVESQEKSISKLSGEKKLLRVELFELSNQNKTLTKDKAKLQREIESLKTESVKVKNLSQSFKTRLEELKANIRAIRREKETVTQEKRNAELRLKKLAVDYGDLKKELKAKKPRKRAGMHMNRVIAPKLKEKLKSLFLSPSEELDDLETSLGELRRRKRNEKEKLRTSEAVREYLKRNTSR